MATASTTDSASGGSQTLARGLTAITLIGEATPPLTVTELATRLGIHRSMAYRLVKTLEQHGFVERTAGGALELGLHVSTLARGVAKDLQSAAAPHLAWVADELGMTSFLVTFDGESAVTLGNTEPRNAATTVAQRPGSRHSIHRGAPGHVIRSQLYPEEYPPKRFEHTRDEVLPGLSSLAVPIPGERPAALAVLYVPQPLDTEHAVTTLLTAAERIAGSMR